MKLWYYIKSYGYNALPRAYFRKRYRYLKEFQESCDPDVLNARLNYYMKGAERFEIPTKAIAKEHIKNTGGTAYYIDLMQHLHYFDVGFKIAYNFGDDTDIPPHPTLFKARKLHVDNSNSILFKLNKRRHFRWVKDQQAFANKKSMLVWRGSAYQPLRREFVSTYYKHPLCDVGQTNKKKEDVPWQKDFMTIEEQLQYKFIFCPEGNDVATNLKWAMSSNSLCIMPRPTCESWFMEGTLEAGKHYVEVASDYSDLEMIVDHYSNHPEEAETIINNAHRHVEQFQDEDMEDLLCLLVLEKYARLSGQERYIRFS